jgi:cell division protein FtsQ
MRKEILNKIASIAIWTIFVAVLVLFLGFSETQRSKIKCSDILVQVIDTTGCLFVEPQDIIDLLSEKGYKIREKTLETLPLNKIEIDINNHPSVKNAEVYSTLDGKLHIDVIQRNPILRIINYNSESYYIDNDGALFPLSEKYTARVLVANGNLNEPYNLRYTRNASEEKETDELGRKYILDDLFKLSKFIQGNEFYKSVIEQVFVNENNEIELIPKVGDFTILMGDVEDIETKMENLTTFMKIALPREGWAKYSIINMKYKNQIVCTKKEGYEPTE